MAACPLLCPTVLAYVSARAMDAMLPDRYPNLLQALGSLVVRFSVLEESIRDVIMLVSGSKGNVVPILTSGLPFKTLVEKFGAVCVELAPVYGSQDDIKAFCGLLHKINEDRNVLVHSVWPSEPSDDPYLRYKMSADARKGLNFNFRNVTADEVNALVVRIGAAEVKLVEIALRPVRTPSPPGGNL